MKKILTYLCLAVTGLVVACSTYDDSVLKSEIENLKTRVASLENSYKQLANYETIVNNLKSVTGVKDNGDGSFTISFSDNTSITLTSGSNGTNGTNGTDGVTPKFKIEDGNWFVSYDEGKTWTQLGSATGTSLFQDAFMDGDTLVLILADGTEFRVSQGGGQGGPGGDQGGQGGPGGGQGGQGGDQQGLARYLGDWVQSYAGSSGQINHRMSLSNTTSGLYMILTDLETSLYIPVEYDEANDVVNALYPVYDQLSGYLGYTALEGSDNYRYWFGYPMELNPATGKYRQVKDVEAGALFFTLKLNGEVLDVTPGQESWVYISVYYNDYVNGAWAGWSSRQTMYYIDGAEGHQFVKEGGSGGGQGGPGGGGQGGPGGGGQGGDQGGQGGQGGDQGGQGSDSGYTVNSAWKFTFYSGYWYVYNATGNYAFWTVPASSGSLTDASFIKTTLDDFGTKLAANSDGSVNDTGKYCQTQWTIFTGEERYANGPYYSNNGVADSSSSYYGFMVGVDVTDGVKLTGEYQVITFTWQ